MTPSDFLQKVQEGALSEADVKQFIDGMHDKLEELKRQNPAKYLETIRNLREAIEAINKTLQVV
jgi:polyhydroxyalkanoate synthesis regulator phasin